MIEDLPAWASYATMAGTTLAILTGRLAVARREVTVELAAPRPRERWTPPDNLEEPDIAWLRAQAILFEDVVDVVWPKPKVVEPWRSTPAQPAPCDMHVFEMGSKTCLRCGHDDISESKWQAAREYERQNFLYELEEPRFETVWK